MSTIDADTLDGLHKLFGELNRYVAPKFGEQRQEIPKIYKLSDTIRTLSKDGIGMLVQGDLSEAKKIESEIIKAWNDMIFRKSPKIFGLYMCAEAGKEMVEFLIVSQLFPYIAGFESEIDFESGLWDDIMPDVIGMEEMVPVWFFGVADALSELSRMIDRYITLNRRAIAREERMDIRERFVCVAEEWYRFLEEVNRNAVPGVMNDTNRRGFRGSFRSVLNRPRGAINHQIDLLNLMIEAGPNS